MKKTKFKITDDDYTCLKYLWLWKVATTTLLKYGVYKTKNMERTYRRLFQLEKRRLIQSISNRDQSGVFWTLTEKGFKEIQFNHTKLIEYGYATEHIEHDFWVTAIHQAGWIIQKPESAAYFTEQQLRRFDKSSFADWVPDSVIHRPDGYWKTDLSQSNSKSLVALEVELNKKPPVSYNDIGEFYSSRISISQVLWFVPTISDGHYIQRHLALKSATSAKEHSFILMSQFISNQWQAQVFLGKSQGLTVSDILKNQKTPVAPLRVPQGYLDIRKKPINSMKSVLPKSHHLGLSRYI